MVYERFLDSDFAQLDSIVANLGHQRADGADGDMNVVAVLEEDSGLAEIANSGRRSSQDEGARLEYRALRKVGNLLANREDHVPTCMLDTIAALSVVWPYFV